MSTRWAFALTMLCALPACSFSPAGLTVGTSHGDGGTSIDGMILSQHDGGDGQVMTADGGPDAARDAAPIDAAPSNPCTGTLDNSRMCDGNFTAHCTGGQVIRERPCPSFTLCLGAECMVSPLAPACSTTSQCSGSDICTPFVTHPLFSTAVELHCATPDGAAGPGVTLASCTSGTQCQTGICTDDGHCFGGCRDNGDCGGGAGGMSGDCHAISVHVDGQSALINGCGPTL